MTQEQVESEFANVPLRFNSYFKYSFYFSGTSTRGNIIAVSLGGNADDIYREQVNADETRTLGKVTDWRSVRVTAEDVTTELFDYYD